MVMLRVISFLAILIAFCTSCRKISEKASENSSDTSTRPVDKDQRLKEAILGKKIPSLKVILGDTAATSDFLLLYYTGFDCQSCIETGLKAISYVNNAYSKQLSTGVVALQSDISADINMYSFHGPIYEDLKGTVHKELKYIKTPVLLYIDENEIISRVNFPKTGQQVDSTYISGLLR